MDYISGQRFHPDWTRVGGIFREIPDEAMFVRLVKEFVNDEAPHAIDDLTGLVSRTLNAYKNPLNAHRVSALGF